MEIRCSLNTTHLPKSMHSYPSSPPFTKCCRKFPQHRKLKVHCSVSEANRVSWGCEIDSLENANRFQKWLNKEGLPPQKLAIQKVDVGGRGLVALKNIRKGEKLLYVPHNLIITTDSAWSSPALGDILRRNSVPEWPFLAIYLISEASLNKSSRWRAYISALPSPPPIQFCN
ncbi:hypothetical protein KI387_003555, partial [Taxus chinensis]